MAKTTSVSVTDCLQEMGRIQELAKGGSVPAVPYLFPSSLFFPFPSPSAPLEVGLLEGMGSAVSSASGVRGGAPA